MARGKWVVLKDAMNQNVDSLVTAVHANLIPVPVGSGQHREGKVLYFHARYVSNYDEGWKFVSCLYDPATNEIIQYTIPPWSETIGADIDPSKLFCSGHTLLANGMLLVAGGERSQPPWGANGIRYSYLFDPSVLDDTDPRPWKK